MKWEVFWLVLYVSRKCSTSDAGEYIYFHWTLLAVFSIIIVANIWSHICGHCTVQFVFTAYLTCKSMRPRCNLSKSVDVVLFLYCWLFCQKYIPWSIYYSTVFSFFFFFFFTRKQWAVGFEKLWLHVYPTDTYPYHDKICCLVIIHIQISTVWLLKVVPLLHTCLVINTAVKLYLAV